MNSKKSIRNLSFNFIFRDSQKSNLAPLVFSMYNVVILCFVLNIFISSITESFDKVRNRAKKEINDFDFFNQIKLKWKNRFRSKVNNLPSYKIYKDHLYSFETNINRLIDYTKQVKFIQFNLNVYHPN